MPVYEYAALDERGQVVRGTVHGPTLDAAARSLAERGLRVQTLGVYRSEFDRPLGGPGAGAPAPAAAAPAPRPSAPPPTEPRGKRAELAVGPLVGAVPLAALHFFFRQLGTMLHAGLNPADALDSLARNASSGKLRGVIAEARDHAIAGRPISVGLQSYPEVFTPLMVSMVRAGEEGGFLDEQCLRLSDYIRQEIELRSTIRRETAMPKLTVAASVAIILGANSILAAVAPGAPGLTAPVGLWTASLGALTAGFLFARFGLRAPAVRRSFDAFTLRLPWIGGMVMGFAMAKFGRAFGALYRGGVPLPRAVELAADACGNEAVRARIYPAAHRLESGAGITETFSATGAFSPLVLDMTRTGETTGDMDRLLVKASEFYEDEGRTRAQQSAKVIGVVCLLVVAVYVLFLLLSFYGGYVGRLGGTLE